MIYTEKGTQTKSKEEKIMLINKEMIEKAKGDIYRRENGLWGRKSVFGLYKDEHDAIIGTLVDYVLGAKAAVCSESFLMNTVDTVEREYAELTKEA
jgi:hypothetical protein